MTTPTGKSYAPIPRTLSTLEVKATVLAKLDLAYLHIFHFSDEDLLRDIRALWVKPLLVIRAGRTIAGPRVDLESGLADIVPIGKLALANPDFFERYTAGAEMNEPDWTTLFGGDATGYTDYPTLATA